MTWQEVEQGHCVKLFNSLAELCCGYRIPSSDYKKGEGWGRTERVLICLVGFNLTPYIPELAKQTYTIMIQK